MLPPDAISDLKLENVSPEEFFYANLDGELNDYHCQNDSLKNSVAADQNSSNFADTDQPILQNAQDSQTKFERITEKIAKYNTHPKDSHVTFANGNLCQRSEDSASNNFGFVGNRPSWAR